MWMLLMVIAPEVWELGFYMTNSPVQQFLGLHRSLFSNKKLALHCVGLACSYRAKRNMHMVLPCPSLLECSSKKQK